MQTLSMKWMENSISGAELMLAGFSLSDASCGQPLNQEKLSCDFDSHIWVFEEVK